MKTYGRIDSGLLAEIIGPATFAEDGEMYDPDSQTVVEVKAGDEIPISWRYTPAFVATLIDITDLVPVPQLGDIYDGGVFSAPPPYVPPPNPWAK